jgi:hypothetical protein
VPTGRKIHLTETAYTLLSKFEELAIISEELALLKLDFNMN